MSNDTSSAHDDVPKRITALLVSVAVAIGAQLALNAGLIWLAVVGYLVAVGCVVVGAQPAARVVDLAPRPTVFLAANWRFGLIVVALLAGAATFALSTGNRYRVANVVPWLLSMVCWWLACSDWRWLQTLRSARLSHLRAWFTPARLAVALALVGVLALGAGFRYADLYNNPRDMNSDQAEKLLDVHDVLDGTTYIFFERNTGREPWQFYWTVALVKLFGINPDFMALKIGTALIGWLMLPAIFLLSREVFSTRTALLATLFAAVASWGVITSRFGLRYPLAPCAAAWTLYFLVRGLRRHERSALLAAGIWAGIGMQGYTAYRFMVVVVPLVVVAWMGWLVWHRQRALAWRTFADASLALVLAALVMMPLLRYAVERPDQLLYRAATRLSGAEQAIVGSPVAIIADNLKNVLLMFNYTGDEVWVANLPNQPAMDTLLGALLVIGAAAVLVQSVRSRNPWPALLLGAGVLMLVPSALSIAFPRENPSVVRTGGAMPALLIVCAAVPGMLLDLAQWTRQRLPRLVTLASVAVLVCAVVLVNRERVFAAYPAQYCAKAQNASDIAHAMDAFVAAGNDRHNAWIVGYPYWVDSRAVGVWIGDIRFPNTVMGADQVVQVDLGGQPGWFALNSNDVESLAVLHQKYPQGQAQVVQSSLCAGREFVVFTTPGQ